MRVRSVCALAVLFVLAVCTQLLFISDEAQSAPRWVVVVDAGHGGKDPGATGYSGTYEKDVNLEIARYVRLLSLSDPSIEVILTRYDDRFIDLRERINIAERSNADIYISIHANAHNTHKPNGIETVIHETRSSNYSASLSLAKKLQAVVVSEMSHTGVRDRGVKERALYTRWASMPAVILETGFVTNPTDERNLQSVWYQLDLARSILDGARSFLN